MTEKNWDMYKYILESKEAVQNIVNNQASIFMEGLDYCSEKRIEQIYLLGSGTSYHASYSAKKIMEDALKIKVTVMYPMEFVDNEGVFNKNTLVIGVSHAGRSASTIKALDKAKELGLYTISSTAEKGSPIEEHADAKIYIEIGEEYAGPKTKGYIGTIATLVLFGLNFSMRLGTLSVKKKKEYENQMSLTCDNIPEIAQNSWDWYKSNSNDLLKCRRLIVLGYDNCVGAMMEGTLKILEAVRYSVVGYELEEFMHGVYHSIDENTYLLALGSQGKDYERLINMLEYFEKERGAKAYVITSDKTQSNGKNFVYPFENNIYFASMEYVVPLQVLARKMSLDLGIDCNISSDPNFHRKMRSYTY